MGRAYAADCDRSDGNEGGRVSSWRPIARPAGAKVEGDHAGRLPRAGKRHPPAEWNGGQDKRSVEAAIPTGEGLHLLRPLRARVLPAAPRAHKPKVETCNLCELYADGSDRRSVVAWRKGRKADHRCFCGAREYGFAVDCQKHHLANRRNRRTLYRRGRGHRPRMRYGGEPAAVAEQRATKPEWMGGRRTDGPSC